MENRVKDEFKQLDLAFTIQYSLLAQMVRAANVFKFLYSKK